MPVVAAPSPIRPSSLGSSLLMRSNGIRAQSCGSIRRSMPKRDLSSPPGKQLAPIDGRIPTPDYFCKSPAALHSTKYLPSLSSEAHGDPFVDPEWPSESPHEYGLSKSSVSESLVEWKPKQSGKLTFKTKAFSDLTQRICMTIPRSLSINKPKIASSSPMTALDRLYWPRQINTQVSGGPSGMLLRIENLRKAAIRLHSELQKNRFSLQVIRQGVQRSKSEIDGDQFQALPPSPLSQTTPKSKRAQKDLRVTCSIDMPISSAELKGIIDAEEEKGNIKPKRT